MTHPAALSKAIAADPLDFAVDALRKLEPRERPLAWIDIACSIASALHYLHNALGIPHGGIDMNSIRISSDGAAKLFDPGLARTEGDLKSLREKNPSWRAVSSQDILKFTSGRSGARFIKDMRDFGTTMLGLLVLDNGYPILDDMLVAQGAINGWPYLVRDLAVDALSTFISCGKDDWDSEYQPPHNPHIFADYIPRFKQLVVPLQFHSSRSIKTSVGIFAERILPISFPSTPPTVVEIMICEVADPKTIHREFYALMKINSGGEKT
ncbi:hypothetical protein DL93DRAFT_2228596 [Clavulina sp. PMI_390]|nr:hypothetical protein DL93DRAFT_2228596 [Clavulina sp. PMI_390]